MIKLISKCFVLFDAIINEIVFEFSLQVVIVYKCNFFLCIAFVSYLTNSFILKNASESLCFSVYKILQFVNRNNLTFFLYIFSVFFFFFILPKCSGYSSTVLTRSGKNQ